MRLLIPLCCGLLFLSCQNKPSSKIKDNYLFKVGEAPIFSDEFIYAYSKNNFNNDSIDRRKDINEYLDLFVRFKLKVKEGKELGLDTTEIFKTELEGYQKQLAKPYLSEKGVTEELIKEGYTRMQTEILAAHILLNLGENAEPADTAKIYEKIQEIKNEIIEGADFSEQAKKYSQDPSAQKNGGQLGYFSAFQMVYPFESVAFKTGVGKVSEPIRTRFGYHLVKVIDKRKARGRAKVSHIMVRATDGISEEDSLKAVSKINEIHSRILNNEEWGVLCAQFSDDFNSKTKGGALPWFSSGQMIPSFADAAFALSSKGDISKPVKTAYGWHIIRLDNREGIKTFEEEREDIEKKVNRDSRGELSKKVFLQRLKKEHSLIEYSNELEKCLKMADSTLLRAQWVAPTNSEPAVILFQLDGNDYLSEHFYKYVLKNQKRQQGLTPKKQMRSLYPLYLEEALMAAEESSLGDKYPDYRMLLNEYHEGIMLFELMDERVWSKAVKDTAGLANYFNEHIAEYQWSQRAEAVIYNAQSQSVIDSIKIILDSNDSSASTKKSLEQHFNQNSPLTLQISDGSFEIKNQKFLSQIKAPSVGSYTIIDEGRVNYIVIEVMKNPEAKTLNEVRGLVISEYQNFLEDEWVGSLKSKYPVKINDKELEKIISDFENR